jgi:plasmid maintenance system antidote protein VapI
VDDVVIAEMVTPTHPPGMAQSPESLLPRALADEMRPERIGARLYLLRMAHDLSPSEISDMLGIERTYWSRFEGGKRAVTEAVAALLVARFGITLDWLILGKWDKLPLDLAEKLRSVPPKTK